MNDRTAIFVAPLSNPTDLILRPAAPIEKVKPAPIVKARTTRKPRKVGLSAADVRVLYRTRMVMDFGKRIFSFDENAEFTKGSDTSTAQWARLKRMGYVTESRSGPKLTAKGHAKLKELGK